MNSFANSVANNVSGRRCSPRTWMILLLTALVAVSVVSLLIGAGSVGP
ncbi:MAG TPA: ABC transporter permease, partial [Halomonas sp.]|nr:ABC transporter permease [Halomonas sp.]